MDCWFSGGFTVLGVSQYLAFFSSHDGAFSSSDLSVFGSLEFGDTPTP